MKRHNARRIKVRRRKVAHLIARSRQFSITNNCIKPAAVKVEINPDTGNGKWNPTKSPQTKSLMKKHTELVYNKETGMTERVFVASTFTPFVEKEAKYQNSLWKNLSKDEKIEAYTQDKLKKWERKNPKPCETDDMFKDEYIPAWEKDRENALTRIRDFVVAIYDNKLKLYGRYKKSEKVFEEKKIAEIKDKTGEGSDINNLDPSTSPLLKTAQKITDKEKRVNPSLVATNLKDRNNKKGRLILPRAA